MKAKTLMIQGTSSGAGKSTIVTALCRIFTNCGYRVAPFKAQNMSSKLYITKDTAKMAQAQAVQAVACKKEPETRMNPVLLKPVGNYTSDVFLNGKFHSTMNARDYYEKFVLRIGLPSVLKAIESLGNENDLVIVEGAGSPAEINIVRFDIANMLLAKKIRSPVLVVSDIERGGSFASIVGTMRLFKPSERDLVQGYIINKFLGDISILEPAIKAVEKITERKFYGVIPKVDFNLPDEDSLGQSINRMEPSRELWDSEIELISKVVKDNINIHKIMEKVVGLDPKI
jgi:adenosylcobyric acid synthase